jgi:predicted metal-dependent hydrolase
MEFDWSCGELAAGLNCYRSGEFFDAHEHWEQLWRGCHGPERSFLQALIQIAVSFHHIQRGNRTGSVRLLSRALGRLEGYPASYGGLNLTLLSAELRAWLRALEHGEATSVLMFPLLNPALNPTSNPAPNPKGGEAAVDTPGPEHDG